MRSDLIDSKVVASLDVGSAGPGASVDLADCNEANVMVIAGGVGATYTLQDSDDDVAFADAADADVLQFDANGLVEHLNGLVLAAHAVGMMTYIGAKRYVRVATSAADGGALVEKESLRHGNHDVV